MAMEMNELGIVGKEVTHGKYGTGTITGAHNNQIIVQFPGDLIRNFKYPDAFEGFLTTKDKELQKCLRADLKKRQGDSDYIAEKQSEKVYSDIKEFEKKKAEEREEKIRHQIEKQRGLYLRSRMRIQQFEKKPTSKKGVQ